ncbi:MAG: GHMP kinase [Gemmatimonadetes bacterium]|nr:MAG: GHMP kinase [Gemmatimonadota bacterium]
MNWFQPALDRLDALPRDPDRRLQTFFSSSQPVYIARAPGRLDVMGGIADYSGARVLELPLACSTSALVQPQSARHCDIATRRGESWDVFSIELPLGEPVQLAAWFRENAADRWASYVVGVVQALGARSTAAGGGGLRILVDSTVPEGRGVASSAALEVAVATAVAASSGVEISAPELAALCQRVENEVVGAPCGIMDQMTSACGKKGKLLQLRCQPGTIEGHVDVPTGYRFYGIDSGISHAVSGADYGTVRTAAFMGLRIITTETPWRGEYLANLAPAEFARFSKSLPEEMTGAEFLERYDDIADTATRVIPERRYPVRQATRHPVGEQDRVDRFATVLAALPDDPALANELGELMYASHESYSACGLGSEGTDRLVELVRTAGPERGLFGAKITGGGSGGTVAVLGTIDAEGVIRDLAARYAAETGRAGSVFTGSGPGAAETGVTRTGARRV